MKPTQKLIESVARGMAAAFERGRCNEVYDDNVDINPFVKKYMEENWQIWVESAKLFINLGTE